MTGDEIREAFLNYFESKGHLRMTSSGLIPLGDPTLLLTNAGMVQFKPFFIGEAAPPNKRLTSAQKCFRTVDIDEVGDSSHLTLFEMLGNFSIGDYFKEEAIKFALDFTSQRLDLTKERFAITIHNDDDESFKLWQDMGIPAARIYRFGDEDNWWGPAGLEGPCGPCSELHYEFGPDQGCGFPDCGPNCTRTVNESGDTCSRFIELWNLVFMQFYHHLDGSRTSLPSPSVDTGMGLERAAIIMQGVDTIYQTDLFSPLIKKVQELSGEKYGVDQQTDYAIRVVAEHARSATFLIADGVLPGNEGRGYVLRRIIRRAIRHGRKLGLNEAFLSKIAHVTIGMMGESYPELLNQRDSIFTVMRLEESRFQQAFQNGYLVLMDALADGSEKLSGEILFKLWDTYGFPIEITQEIAREKNIEIDLDGFEREMEAQRERARATAQFRGDRSKIHTYESLGAGTTHFLGYQQLTANPTVVGLIRDDSTVNEVTKGQSIEVALTESPFYPEGGGQVGDMGELVGPNGSVEIHDTQMVMPDLIIHFGEVSNGRIALGDTVNALVDPLRREDTARNHTATHMLHAALRLVLGTHVRQSGSLVNSDRLRFDFSHVNPLTEEELWQVQSLVNEKIRQNASVLKSEDSYNLAIKRGALAFFGDKYGDMVRLVEIANGTTFSFEVCGGTHVEHTGQVGAVYILGESSIGSGMRRIEAVSGRGAERLVRERFNREDRIANRLQTTLPELETRVHSLVDELSDLRREKESLEKKLSLQLAGDLLTSKQEVNGITLLVARVPVSNADALREIGDWLKEKIGCGVVVLGAVVNDRPIMLAMVTQNLVATGIDAREILRGTSNIIRGGGGGRPDLAQAGGRRADKLGEALDLIPDLIARKDVKP